MTIRTDATRQVIRARDPRPLRAVAPRQGQVLLDADVDQDGRLTLARLDGDMDDVIGAPGRLAYPSGTPAFNIVAGAGPLGIAIEPGHGFVDGWRLDNMTTCALDTQPHSRVGDAATLPAVIAVKALIRHIDPVEETAFADKALGDAQASGRLIADWQVLPQPVRADVTCATVLQDPDWLRLAAPSTGTIAVQVQAAGPGSDPCSLTPQGGYTRLENLLYRLEVHGGTTLVEAGGPPALADGPRFGLAGLALKLSRRNASLLVAVTGISGNDITVSPPALDPRVWFAPGTWAELVTPHDDLDPRAALASERLFRVALASDDRVTLEAAAGAVAATGVVATGGWFLRLWDAQPDGTGLIVLAAPGAGGVTASQNLGDGLSLVGGGGTTATFRRGDYWTFAARADGSIDWPAAAPQQVPHGPEIRYAPLAVASAAPALSDCRIPFARLTDRVLQYRGGDGQSAFAGAGGPIALAAPLRLAVMRGSTPVPGAVVEWSLPAGAQPSLIGADPVTAVNQPTTTTDAQGEIAVVWTLDGAVPLALYQVKARLIGDGGAQPITFTARFDDARTTGYDPAGCPQMPVVTNVQDAIDALCKLIDQKFPVITLNGIDLFDDRGTVTPLLVGDLILNGEEVAFDAFLGGITISLLMNQNLVLGIRDFDPIIELELDLPYPTTDFDKAYWAAASQPVRGSPRLQSTWGFQRIRLAGTVAIGLGPDGTAPALIWKPDAEAAAFIASGPLHGYGTRVTSLQDDLLKSAGWKPGQLDRILCRLRVRSAHVWADDAVSQQRIYLNAEHLGGGKGSKVTHLGLSIRDPQRAADLDMFFYIRPG